MVCMYIDLEYTNGNLYIADILEIAVVSGDTENVFHTLISIDYEIPSVVTEITGLTTHAVQKNELHFVDAITVGELVIFLYSYQIV